MSKHFDVRFVYKGEMFSKGEERKTDLVKEAYLTYSKFYRENVSVDIIYTISPVIQCYVICLLCASFCCYDCWFREHI